MLDPRGLDHTRRRLICPHDRPTVRRARNDSADGVLAQRDVRATADAAPAPLRIAHDISALGIIAIFLAPHLANHLHSSLGLTPIVPRRRRCATSIGKSFCNRCWLRCFLFQVGSVVYLATHSVVRTIDRFRTFQIASGIFLAAYLLGHMNSAFVFARLDLGIDSDSALATAASSG